MNNNFFYLSFGTTDTWYRIIPCPGCPTLQGRDQHLCFKDKKGGLSGQFCSRRHPGEQGSDVGRYIFLTLVNVLVTPSLHHRFVSHRTQG